MLDATKQYEFQVRFGEETDTLDCEGQVIATSDVRPTPDSGRRGPPASIGEIEQVPPAYSALKMKAKRPSALAPASSEMKVPPQVTIYEPGLDGRTDSATFAATRPRAPTSAAGPRHRPRVEQGRPRHHVEKDASRPVRPRKGHFAGLSRRKPLRRAN